MGLVVGLTFGLGLIVTPTVSAQESKSNKWASIEIVQIDNKTLEVIDAELGTTDTVKYVDERTAQIIEDDGTIQTVTFNEAGNAYVNNILVSKVSNEGNPRLGVRPSSSSSPSPLAPHLSRPIVSGISQIQPMGYDGPWLYAGRTYTSRNIQGATAAMAITVAGFVPGFGLIAGIADIIYYAMSVGRTDIYYAITTYVDTSYVWMKQNCATYLDSNYTEYMGTTYGNAVRIHY